MNGEPERLEAILGALPIDDALWLSERLEPAWRARERRLAIRDTAIRETWAQLTGNATARSEELARLLANYIGSAWPHDRAAGGPPAGSLHRRQTLYTIATLNDGDKLAWRQIMRVAKGERTPFTLS